MKLQTSIPVGFISDTSAEYIIPAEVRKLWAVQLDLLAQFDAICRKHNIRYSLDSGSLIGAFRHGGYIPWDDDIDVVMPSSDFRRFEEVVEDELADGYFYQNWKKCPGYCRTFGRLLNLNTKAYIKDDLIGDKPLWNYPQSVFLDVLVAHNVPDDAKERTDYFEKLSGYWKRYWRARRALAFAKHWRIVPPRLSLYWLMLQGLFLRLLAAFGLNLSDKWFTCFRVEQTRYESIVTKEVAPFSDRPYEILAKSEFDNLDDVKFEFLSVKAFKNYDSILTKQYGDWRKHVVSARMPMKYDLSGVYDD